MKLDTTSFQLHFRGKYCTFYLWCYCCYFYATAEASYKLQVHFLNAFLYKMTVWTHCGFGLRHLHWKHIWRGAFNSRYEEEERLQQGKPPSVFIWAPDCCFNMDLKIVNLFFNNKFVTGAIFLHNKFFLLLILVYFLFR